MLHFIPALREDLPAIVAIYNQSIPSRLATADTEPVTVAAREDWFAAHHAKRPLWLVKDHDQLVGWLSLSDFYGRPAYQKTAEISLYLADDSQSRGYGQQALTFAEQTAPELEIETLLAFIFHHNTASQRLFKRNAYQLWGHLPAVAEMDGQTYALDILGKRL